MSEQKLRRLEYPLEVEHIEGKRGLLKVGKHEIEVATPPEFRGPEGYISPEDLYVASAGVCIMSTFLTMAERAKANFKSYRSKTIGILQQQEDRSYLFEDLYVDIYVVVPAEEDIKRVHRAVELVEKYCLVTNSMKTKTHITPHIEVKP
ncbi:MAG: OsmC family protein [Promethearchaeota archaeon]